MSWLANFFKKHSNKGNIILGCGQHEVTIKVEGNPCKVVLSINDPCDGIPVCCAGVNKIKVTLLCDGFVLDADVQSNTCCVEYVVIT